MAGGPTTFGEVYYGASSRGGYNVDNIGPLSISRNFTDLAANESFALPGPIAFPLVGSVQPTRNLIYVNTP